MFEKGKASAPPVACVCLVLFGYLAYDAYNSSLQVVRDTWTLYALAGASAMAVAPFTLLVMAEVNGKLIAKEEETKSLKATDEVVEVGLGGESVPTLLKTWASLNLIRGFFPLVGALLGCWAALA